MLILRRYVWLGLVVFSGLIVATPSYATETINQMVDRLCAANGISRATVQSARVVNAKQINAYTDGRKIIVYNRLWKLLATDDARAFVVSHELSHILLNHPQHSMTRTVGTRVLNQAIGLTMGPAAYYGVYAGTKLANLKISRNQEYGADEKGLQLMWRAGYNPDGVDQTFRVLERNAGSGGHGRPEFLLNHPLNDKRMAHLAAQYRQMGPAPQSASPSSQNTFAPVAPSSTGTPATGSNGTEPTDPWSSDYRPQAGGSGPDEQPQPAGSPDGTGFPPGQPPDATMPLPSNLPWTTSPQIPQTAPAGSPVVVPSIASPLPAARPSRNPWFSSRPKKPNRYGMTPVAPVVIPSTPYPEAENAQPGGSINPD